MHHRVSTCLQLCYHLRHVSRERQPTILDNISVQPCSLHFMSFHSLTCRWAWVLAVWHTSPRFGHCTPGEVGGIEREQKDLRKEVGKGRRGQGYEVDGPRWGGSDDGASKVRTISRGLCRTLKSSIEAPQEEVNAEKGLWHNCIQMRALYSSIE